jgi:hypothetical protein
MHTYLRLVLDEFDCYGTWLPGTQVRVGEIGTLVGHGSFSHAAWLDKRADMPMPDVESAKEGTKHALVGATVTRAGGASVAAAQVLHALADASISLTMTLDKRSSAALILDQVTRHRFSDERVVREMMETLRRAGKIDLDEIVVTYVLESKSGLVAASSSSDKAGEAEGGVGFGVSRLELAKVKGKLAISAGDVSDTTAVAKPREPLTPMYRALCFRGSRAWWHFWKKIYSAEALIEAAASLRALRIGSRAEFAYKRGVGYGVSPRLSVGSVPGFALTETVDAITNSHPSFALAEQALQELGGDQTIAAMARPAWPPSELDLFTTTRRMDEFQLIDVHKSLGELLREQGDVDGARRQFDRAAAWADALSSEQLPDDQTEEQEDAEEVKGATQPPRGRSRSRAKARGR